MKVVEIFKSLQGEGKNQGRVCLFIRLAGCNLNCNWCDTPDSRAGGTEMSPGAILKEVRLAGLPHVCITGGEPLIQGDELEGLISEISGSGADIDIETNGTLDFSRLQRHASICMDVKCPSSGEQSNLSLLGSIRKQDCVKFVVKDEVDCRYALDVIRNHKIAGDIFMSPVFGTDYSVISTFILDNNMPVRLQIQLHKIIGVK